MRVTIDASVAVKWLVDEPNRERARQMLAPGIERHAPDFLPVECVSAICKKARRGEIGAAAPFVDEITRFWTVIRLHASRTLLRVAAEAALRTGHPVYDCLYIACASITGSVLVTADRRLAEVVSHRIPGVEAVMLTDDSEMVWRM